MDAKFHLICFLRYYLRYLDPGNASQLVDPAIASRDMPVSVYVGGVEHAGRSSFTTQMALV